MFERAKKVFECNIKCLSGPQKFFSRPEKYLSAMRECWRVNSNVFGDIKFIKKLLRYKIPNLKCRRNFYPLGQAYTCSSPLNMTTKQTISRNSPRNHRPSAQTGLDVDVRSDVISILPRFWSTPSPYNFRHPLTFKQLQFTLI